MQFSLLRSYTVHNWRDLSPISGLLAMGNFDGVHLGHRSLIQEAKKQGEVTILTYSPHPAIALGRVKSSFLLTTDTEKQSLLNSLSVKNIIFINFNLEVSNMLPDTFAKEVIKERLNPDRVIIGYDHHFGKGRKGTPDYLQSLGESLGFEVIVYPEVRVNGEAVKSTVIRELIHEGEMEVVPKLLGCTYSISGMVSKGHGLGEELGYPTANIKLDTEYKLLPPNGVYSSIVRIKQGDFPAMLYIGSSPTHGIEERKIELHLIDFTGDLYEQRIECDVYSFIRKVKCFSSKELLKESIKRNKEEVMKTLKEVYK